MDLYAKGQLSFMILTCLLERDFYGLDIISEINKKSDGKITLKKPSVYSNLTRMEKQGYVSSYLKSSDLGPNRKYYSITEKGRSFYQELKSYFERNNIDVFRDFKDFDENDKVNIVTNENNYNQFNHILETQPPQNSVEQEAQTNLKIVISCAKSGIFAGIILGIGRALGEATAVQMVIGNNALGTGFYNPFNSGMTLTSAMLSGIGEATGIRYDVRFSLGIVLILVILSISAILNFVKLKLDTIKTKNTTSVFSKISAYFRNDYELLRSYINDKVRKDKK